MPQPLRHPVTQRPTVCGTPKCVVFIKLDNPRGIHRDKPGEGTCPCPGRTLERVCQSPGQPAPSGKFEHSCNGKPRDSPTGHAKHCLGTFGTSSWCLFTCSSVVLPTGIKEPNPECLSLKVGHVCDSDVRCHVSHREHSGIQEHPSLWPTGS